jgi:hypothetical protein
MPACVPLCAAVAVTTTRYGSCLRAIAQLHGVAAAQMQLSVFVWQQATPALHAHSGVLAARLLQAVLLFAAGATGWGLFLPATVWPASDLYMFPCSSRD